MSTTHSGWCEALRLDVIDLSRVWSSSSQPWWVSVVFPKGPPGNNCRLDQLEFVGAPSGGAPDDH